MGASHSSATTHNVDPNNHTIPMLETGDIVLFKCKNGKKVLQQQQLHDSITTTLNSQYHHVGIILRTHVDGYKVIDWSVGEGIGCTSLADKLNDPTYTAAAIRKLVIQLRNKQVDRLNQFLQQLKTTPSDDAGNDPQASTGLFCGLGGSKKQPIINAFTADRPNKGWSPQAITELEFDFLLAALAQQTFRSAASFIACCYVALELLAIDTNYLAFTPASFSQPADSPNALRLASGAYLDEAVILPMHTPQLVFRRTAVAPITTVHGTTQNQAYSQQLHSQQHSEVERDYLRAQTYSQRLVAAANDAAMNKHTSLDGNSSSSFSTNSSMSGHRHQLYTQQVTAPYQPALNSQDQEILASTSETTVQDVSNLSSMPSLPASLPAMHTTGTTLMTSNSSTGQVHIAPMSLEFKPRTLSNPHQATTQGASNSSSNRSPMADSDQSGGILTATGSSPANASLRESHENVDFRVVMAQSAALALLGKPQPSQQAYRAASQQRFSQHQLPHINVTTQLQQQQPVNYHPPAVRQQLLHQRLPDFNASGTVRSTVPELSLEYQTQLARHANPQQIASVPASILF